MEIFWWAAILTPVLAPYDFANIGLNLLGDGFRDPIVIRTR